MHDLTTLKVKKKMIYESKMI